MKVRCSEGGAIHTDPESCGGRREATGEALTGDDIGQPLSGESPIPGADVVMLTEGNTNLNDNCKIKFDLASSKTLACIDAFHAGTGRSPHWSRSDWAETSSGR